MKKLTTSILASLSVLTIATAAAASHHSVEKPARVVSTTVKRSAIVESVNAATRELRLIDSRGNRFTVVADERVRNFDQIEPRDRIVAEYVESVAVVIAPEGSEPPIGSGGAVAVAPAGDKPGFEAVDTILTMATVESINLDDRLATLLLDNGELRTVKVSENARLDKVEVGDQVRLRITQAVAVSVVEPEE